MKSPRHLQLEAFLAEDPDDPFTHYALALEMLKDDVQEGLSKMEWLLEHHPGYLATYYQLGKLYEAAGRTNEAIETYRNGMLLATLQQNKHAFGELKGAVDELEENDPV